MSPGLTTLAEVSLQCSALCLSYRRSTARSQRYGWQRIHLVDALDKDHADVDVGMCASVIGISSVLLLPVDRAFDSITPLRSIVISFDCASVGAGDQHFGGVARFVALLVGDQVDAVVVARAATPQTAYGSLSLIH